MNLRTQHTTDPRQAVRVVDWGSEYTPGADGGPPVTYLHHEASGTVLRICGATWGYDLRVSAETWYGYVPRPEDRDKTHLCRVRHTGATHKQVVGWYRDELAGLHRQAVDA